MNQIIQEIRDAAEIAQRLIAQLYEIDPKNETFEQVGLLDGQKIVADYIDHSEWACALQHLLYMIHQSDIRFPRETMLHLHEIAKSHGLKNHYSKVNQANLNMNQVASIFNAP